MQKAERDRRNGSPFFRFPVSPLFIERRIRNDRKESRSTADVPCRPTANIINPTETKRQAVKLTVADRTDTALVLLRDLRCLRMNYMRPVCFDSACLLKARSRWLSAATACLLSALIWRAVGKTRTRQLFDKQAASQHTRQAQQINKRPLKHGGRPICFEPADWADTWPKPRLQPSGN